MPYIYLAREGGRGREGGKREEGGKRRGKERERRRGGEGELTSFGRKFI
jgi:hypothetical protein